LIFFADDVEQFPALRKSSTVNVDLQMVACPLLRFKRPANQDARITRRAKGSSITMAETYLPTEQYRAAVNAIAALTGIDTDAVKITLGEEANIWPASIRPDGGLA
jgi:hypothetical protein